MSKIKAALLEADERHTAEVSDALERMDFYRLAELTWDAQAEYERSKNALHQAN